MPHFAKQPLPVRHKRSYVEDNSLVRGGVYLIVKYEGAMRRIRMITAIVGFDKVLQGGPVSPFIIAYEGICTVRVNQIKIGKNNENRDSRKHKFLRTSCVYAPTMRPRTVGGLITCCCSYPA